MDKKIPVSDVTQGMFVSALDRPWTDTPFLLQGFLVETPEDVANLRRYCTTSTSILRSPQGSSSNASSRWNGRALPRQRARAW